MLTTTRSSHVRIYETCPRQWYLHHTSNYVNCKSDAMAWGVEMHEHLERWFGPEGTPPPNTPTGRAARLSLQHLPARRPQGTGLMVELKWAIICKDMWKAEQFTYTGAIDLCDVEIRSANAPASYRTYVQMWDHKSCADVKWAKSAEELANDISACAYAHYLCRHYDVDEVRCRWVYTQRDGRKSVPVDFVITKEHAAARWQLTMQSVAEMQAILQRAAPTDVVAGLQGNLSACDSYGGCPFRDKCHPSPSDFTLAPPQRRATLPIVTEAAEPPVQKEPVKMSALLAKIKAGLGTVPAPTATPAVVADPINPPDAAPHNTPDPAATFVTSTAANPLSLFSSTELLDEIDRRLNKKG